MLLGILCLTVFVLRKRRNYIDGLDITEMENVGGADRHDSAELHGDSRRIEVLGNALHEVESPRPELEGARPELEGDEPRSREGQSIIVKTTNGQPYEDVI